MSQCDKHGRFELSLDGSHACALYGPDLQAGEAEFAPIEGWPNATYKQERAAMSAAYEALAARLGKRLPFDIVHFHEQSSAPSSIVAPAHPVPIDGRACERIYDEAYRVAIAENAFEDHDTYHRTALVHVYAAGQRSVAPVSAIAPTDPVTEGTVEQDAARFRFLTRTITGEIKHVGSMFRRWRWDTLNHAAHFPKAVDAAMVISDDGAKKK